LGLQELIQTLRDNQQSQIDQLWQAVKAEAAKLRDQTSKAISDLTEVHTDNLVCSCQKSVRTIIVEAESDAKRIKLVAVDSLGKSLYDSAVKLLKDLRKDNYAAVFHKLLQELPDQEWETVTVNPDDVQHTENLFKNCTIMTNPDINGGMVASTMDGKITINNTLEKRLERSWSTLFPGIIREIEKEYAESQPLTESTSK
jgi:vacuolar-type H+-ATPase subunit E/Vma4